jgi:hypothetical protein
VQAVRRERKTGGSSDALDKHGPGGGTAAAAGGTGAGTGNAGVSSSGTVNGFGRYSANMSASGSASQLPRPPAVASPFPEYSREAEEEEELAALMEQTFNSSNRGTRSGGGGGGFHSKSHGCRCLGSNTPAQKKESTYYQAAALVFGLALVHRIMNRYSDLSEDKSQLLV